MKVSILIITYNHDQFIAQAIDSVLMQEVDFDYEIVIGEDCSTDSTRQIVLDYQRKYPDKIRLLLPEENLGMLKNFVSTYKACQGEYVALLEGDDYWISPRKLAVQVNFLDNNPDCSMCFNDTVTIEAGEHSEPTLFIPRSSAKAYTIKRLLQYNFISTPSVMYRHKLIGEFPSWYYEQSLGDWSLHILHAQHGKIGYIDEVMSAYRIHSAGAWSGKDDSFRLRATIKMLKSICNHLGDDCRMDITNSIAHYSQTLSSIQLKTAIPPSSKMTEKYKIHVGCGKHHFNGWINLDIEADNPCADLVCDARQQLPFPDKSCSLVYNEHFLEHLTVEEGLSFLKECHRILEPGGTLRIAMPSLKYIIDKYNSVDWQDQDWLQWKDYEFVKTRAEMINIAFRWWEHKWLYDEEELNRRLIEAGYVNIRPVGWRDSDILDLRDRETREDSILIFEAEAPLVKASSLPLVSICIPTYNGGKFLAATMQSVLAQTYQNLEIIFSDDCSSDDTIAIARTFQEKTNINFSIFEHEQYGMAANWNFCISQAKGKYIKFVFQDDLLEPDAISEMVQLAEIDEEVGFVFSSRTIFVTDGDNYCESGHLESHEANDVHLGWSKLQLIQSGQDLLSDPRIFDGPINKIGEPTTVLIKRSIFDRVGGFNPELHQLVDLEMWLRIINVCKVGFVNKYLSHFRLHRDQQTHRNSIQKELILTDFQKFFGSIFEDPYYPESFRKLAFHRHVLVGKQLSNLPQIRIKITEELLSLTDSQVEDACNGLLGTCHGIIQSFVGKSSVEFTEQEQIIAERLKASLFQENGDITSLQTLLAASLYYRVDQLPLPYDLSCIPEFLLPIFFEYLFMSLGGYTRVGESLEYYTYIKGWINYVSASAFADPANSFWRNAVKQFVSFSSFIPFYFNEENLKDVYVARAKMLELYLESCDYKLDYRFSVPSNTRKKIRLGILANHFIPAAETFAALPIYEYLGRDFEVILFSFRETSHPLEQYCRATANFSVLLPGDLSSQVAEIRAADLDILFIASNLTAINNPIYCLAAHRLARVQVTSGGSVTTTGLRSMDYFLSGTMTDPAPLAQEQYQEKLLQLAGTSHCFSYGNYEPTATVQVDRATLGIAEDAVVFTSGANFYKLIPDLLHTWAQIIAEVPNSVIMLFPFGPNWSSSYPQEAFAKHLHSIFAEYGVSADRVLALDPQPTPNRADLKEFYKLADIYLDSYPFAGTTSLIEPLQVGLPVVARQGDSFRSAMGAAIIQSLGIPDLVGQSAASYIKVAIELGNNPEFRQQKSREVVSKMQNNPSFLDSKGYALQVSKLFRELLDEYNATAFQDSLRLSEVNVMVVPDWNQPEESVGMELQQVIQTLATQPESQQTTLLIDTTNISIEDADMFLSTITMNLMMEEDLDITEELEITLIEDLHNIPWAALQSRIDARLILDCDNHAVVSQLAIAGLQQVELSSFVQRQQATAG
jgi:predicted O-linked N-acetylglucosamine transferase (SPINDLY family)/predicted SAM-dependent methyltransferase/glycosyltransferase involved in cell wall biosynthesis